MDPNAGSSSSSNDADSITPPPTAPSMDLKSESLATYADQAIPPSSTSSSSAAPLTSISKPIDPQPSISFTTQPLDQPQDNTQSVSSFQLLSYLRSLSAQDRLAQDLYSVSVPDLTQASLLGPPLLKNHNSLFLEVLNSAANEETFIAVPCYFCDNLNSSSTEENSTHVLEEHIDTPTLEMLDMLPKQAPAWWITAFHIMEWSPLDPATFQPATSSTARERAQILAQIMPVFRFLAGRGIFTVNHIAALVELALATVPTIPSRKWLQEVTLTQPNVCIRVLDVLQLQTTLRYLEALKTCGLDINKENSVFVGTQDEEKYELYLVTDKVTVFLKKYGEPPGDLVRWLCDSSWYHAIESREHKIRQVIRKYLQVSVLMGRACHMKRRRLDHLNALNKFRFLSLEDLKKKFCTAKGIEKIAIGEIQVVWSFQESNRQNIRIQDVIDKLIDQLHLQCLLEDARILWAIECLDELEPKIGKASQVDYDIVVVPLMKYCMKKRLYNLLEQHIWSQSETEGEEHKAGPAAGEGPNGVSDAQESPKV